MRNIISSSSTSYTYPVNVHRKQTQKQNEKQKIASVVGGGGGDDGDVGGRNYAQKYCVKICCRLLHVCLPACLPASQPACLLARFACLYSVQHVFRMCLVLALHTLNGSSTSTRKTSARARTHTYTQTHVSGDSYISHFAQVRFIWHKFVCILFHECLVRMRVVLYMQTCLQSPIERERERRARCEWQSTTFSRTYWRRRLRRRRQRGAKRREQNLIEQLLFCCCLL